jgi:hypothetical protein
VDVLGQGLDPGGKALRIGLDVAVGVALALPAVVDDHVLVACRTHAGGDHRVGGVADHPLVDVAPEPVPRIPAHRRRQGEAVRLARRPRLIRERGLQSGERREGQGEKSKPLHESVPSGRIRLAPRRGYC